MASTYSTSLRLELIGTGDQSGTWGNTTNTNLGTLLEQAITGVSNVSMSSDADYTLTTVNGGTDQARQAVLNITSSVSLTATRNIIIPSVNKVYIVKNGTTGGQSLTIKTSSGTGITVTNGNTTAVYCNGTNTFQAIDYFPSVIIDTLLISNTLGVGSAAVDNANIYASKTLSSTTAAQYGTFVNTKSSDSATSFSAFRNTSSGANKGTSYTTTNVYGLNSSNYTLGTNQTVTNQYGVLVNSLTSGTYNYSYYANTDAASASTISTASASGTTVTITTTAGHGLATNDYVLIANAPLTNMTSGSMNGGPYQVTVINSTTFTYSSTAVSSSPVTSGNVVKANSWNFYAGGTGNNWFGGPNIISANSTLPGLRITQVGAGDALVVEDSTNPDRTPFVIDASGTVITGYISAITGYGGRAVKQQVVEGGGGGQINAVYTTNAASPATYEAARSRSSTIGSHTIVQADDWLGYWVASGSDGTQFIRAADMIVQVDGTPGTNDMPGRLVFRTTADGASTPTERMRIDSSGNVGIGTTSPESFGGGHKTLELTGSTNTQGGVFKTATSGSGGTGTTGQELLMYTDTNGGNLNVSTIHPLLFHTSNVERMRIDSSGNFLIGDSTSYTVGNNPRIQISSTGAGASSINALTWSAASASTSPAYNFARSRGAAGVYTAVATDDDLGFLSAYGTDGTAFYRSSYIRFTADGTPATGYVPGRIVFATATNSASATERMRIRSDGGVSIGGTGSSNVSLYVQKTSTSSTTTHGVYVGSEVQSDVTSAFNGFVSVPSTAAASFTLGSLRYFYAAQGTLGAGSSVTSQTGFYSGANLIGATTNFGFVADNTAAVTTGKTAYGFYSSINTATGGGTAYGFFAGGTANNYFGGRLGLNSTSLNSVTVRNNLTLTGGTTSYQFFAEGGIASDVTTFGIGYASTISTNSASSINNIIHFYANPAVGAAGSTVNSSQIGFYANDNLRNQGAATVTAAYGFYSNILSTGGNAWSLYFTGSAPSYFGGVVTKTQAAPASKAAASTATAAEMLGGILNYTGAASTLTLPTGTNMDAGLAGGNSPNDTSFDVSVINTGSGTCTVTAATGFTIVGLATVASNTSGAFRARKTSANTYVLYRMG